MDINLSEELKKQIKDFWNTIPCGTGVTKNAQGTNEFYEDVSAYRKKRELFIPKYAEFEKWKGKKILEVGCGAGSDLIEFAKNGAVVSGIDLSNKSVELTIKRFELYGYKGVIKEADAENLPFDENTFDMVISNGVIHHTPDIVKAISEIYRIVKPDGEIRIMLYHKYSIVSLQMWIVYGLLKGKPFRSLDEIFYYHHESIGTKVYSAEDARELFSQFRDVEIKSVVSTHDVRYGRTRYLPNWTMKLVPDCLGWNLLVKGRK
jgi:ubiquinone/menaquinone biosynthesis C-methylase UbiE